MSQSNPVRIHIFNAGTHEDMSCRTFTISRDDVDQAIANYSTRRYRAPLILSHDTKGLEDKLIASSELAHGVASYFEREGDKVYAVFQDKITPQFKQWVEQGRLHSVSASFYLPESPHNPNPGQFSFRHIAALGKNPPAVKGLEPLEVSACFSAGQTSEDYANFMMAYEMGLKASMAIALAKLRDWLITNDSLESAEKILPLELIATLHQPDYENPWEAIDNCMSMIHELKGDVESLRADCYALKQEKNEDYYEDKYHMHMSYREALIQMSTPAFAGNLDRLQSVSGVDKAEFAEILNGKRPTDEQSSALAEALNITPIQFSEGLKTDETLENDRLRQQLVQLQIEKRMAEIAAFIEARPGQLTPALKNPLPINFSEGGEDKSEKMSLKEFAASLGPKQWAFFSSFCERLPHQGDIMVSSFSQPIEPIADTPDLETAPLNYLEISNKAKVLIKQKRSQGVNFTEREAIDEILATHGITQ